MLFKVNVNVVHGKLQCWSWSISVLFMVNDNGVHGKRQCCSRQM